MIKIEIDWIFHAKRYNLNRIYTEHSETFINQIIFLHSYG